MQSNNEVSIASDSDQPCPGDDNTDNYEAPTSSAKLPFLLRLPTEPSRLDEVQPTSW